MSNQVNKNSFNFLRDIKKRTELNVQDDVYLLKSVVQ